MSDEEVREGVKSVRRRRVALPETVLTEGQLRRIGSRGSSVRNLFRSAFLRKSGPRACIKAFCLDCMGEDKKGIGQCGDRCCPLWHWRPYQTVKDR